MSSRGSLEDLKELLDPIHSFFDGVVWVLHDAAGSEEEKYLNSIKGCGRIINYHYHQRHDQSRNQYLWCGPIKNGDWVCQCDLLERISPNFAEEINKMIDFLKSYRSNAAYFEGKVILYEYHESLIFRGSPHEGLIRMDGNMRPIQLTSDYKGSKPRINVRPIKRPDPFGWVDHYMKYYLFPYGSNHCLLGLEKTYKTHESLVQAFNTREQKRLDFLSYLDNNNIPRTTEAVKILFKRPIGGTLLEFVNSELILNDFYRYHVLGHRDLIDEHNHNNLYQI